MRNKTEFPILHNIRPVISFILLGVIAHAFSIQAATLPFENDFNGGTTDLTLSAETNSSWSISSGALRLSIVDNAGPTASSASTSFPDIDGSSNSSFTLQTDFTVTGTVNSFLFTGFMVLGNDDDPDFNGYLAETRFETGEMRIKRVGAGGRTLVDTTFSPFTAGETYTATVDGVYGNNGPSGEDSLDLTYTISGGDLLSSRQVVGKDEDGASLLSGEHFGLRNRINDTTGVEVAFDNLTVIPEPSSILLVLIGLISGMLVLRRRK